MIYVKWIKFFFDSFTVNRLCVALFYVLSSFECMRATQRYACHIKELRTHRNNHGAKIVVPLVYAHCFFWKSKRDTRFETNKRLWDGQNCEYRIKRRTTYSFFVCVLNTQIHEKKFVYKRVVRSVNTSPKWIKNELIYFQLVIVFEVLIYNSLNQQIQLISSVWFK